MQLAVYNVTSLCMVMPCAAQVACSYIIFFPIEVLAIHACVYNLLPSIKPHDSQGHAWACTLLVSLAGSYRYLEQVHEHACTCCSSIIGRCWASISRRMTDMGRSVQLSFLCWAVSRCMHAGQRGAGTCCLSIIGRCWAGISWACMGICC